MPLRRYADDFNLFVSKRKCPRLSPDRCAQNNQANATLMLYCCLRARWGDDTAPSGTLLKTGADEEDVKKATTSGKTEKITRSTVKTPTSVRWPIYFFGDKLFNMGTLVGSCQCHARMFR